MKITCNDKPATRAEILSNILIVNVGDERALVLYRHVITSCACDDNGGWNIHQEIPNIADNIAAAIGAGDTVQELNIEFDRGDEEVDGDWDWVDVLARMWEKT